MKSVRAKSLAILMLRNCQVFYNLKLIKPTGFRVFNIFDKDEYENMNTTENTVFILDDSQLMNHLEITSGTKNLKHLINLTIDLEPFFITKQMIFDFKNDNSIANFLESRKVEIQKRESEFVNKLGLLYAN